jgi:O-antigen ligase
MRTLRSGNFERPSLGLVLFGTMLVILLIAGGASRADAFGQVIVRTAAVLALIAMALFGRRPAFRQTAPVAFLLGAALLIVLMQLVPLPPDWWQALPGRAPFAQAAVIVGEPQPWRPLALVPGGAANAAASLIVPAAMLWLVTSLGEREFERVPGLLLVALIVCALTGLIQFAGVTFNNPFINETLDQPSGTFANRNHFALFLAFGCLIAPVWATLGKDPPRWRATAAACFTLLFVMMILANGSRAGVALGGLGTAMGLLLVQHHIRRALSRRPRWMLYAFIAGAATIGIAIVALSLFADRAISLNRALESAVQGDMRERSFPTVSEMIKTYFPAGSGFGGFDPMFRMHEPFELLKPTFFNHAHNDFLEVALEGGLPGLALLAAALIWWAIASVRAWSGDARTGMLPRLGSAILLLTFMASLVDYPARTPMMMAVVIIAGVWLTRTGRMARRSALPADSPGL